MGDRQKTASPSPSVSVTTASPPSSPGPVASDRTATGTVERRASVGFSHPRDGDTVTSSAPVSGSADLPDRHQVWLLRRHGTGAAYQVVGTCRGGWNFTCGPADLDTGGDDSFQLTVIVVDPETARSLSAGQSRAVLPGNLAASEITVRRAAG
ncbi:MAG TPA: hypothetical protein VN408_10675 [Actinoplanes sp.]|nr:hypothetical protein [Actinoplanes sp.]